jgi:membrane fusion protein (multidrug efflux system)
MAEASPEIPAAQVDDTNDDAAARAGSRKKWLVRLAMAVAAGALLWVLYYMLVGRNYESTDNAYVNAEMAQVTPMIAATVLDVKVKDTQMVRRGDVLVLLDPETPRISVAEATAQLAEARRRFRQTVSTGSALAATVMARQADITQAQAQVTASQADYETARIDLQRRERLAQSGAVSGEELTNARKALAGARAALARAQAGTAQARSVRASAEGELAANRALISGSTEDTDPGVLAAKAKLDAAQLDLDHTVIRATVDGVVTRRQVQVGERVAIGKSVMAIVPVGKVYIDANFKERQLKRVRVGMPAEVTADIYGGSVTYHGKVTGIAGGTGASMSLIPAQNATGNWIKVVQRLPVRIELDPKELTEHPLRVGLSTEVVIHLTD